MILPEAAFAWKTPQPEASPDIVDPQGEPLEEELFLQIWTQLSDDEAAPIAQRREVLRTDVADPAETGAAPVPQTNLIDAKTTTIVSPDLELLSHRPRIDADHPQRTDNVTAVPPAPTLSVAQSPAPAAETQDALKLPVGLSVDDGRKSVSPTPRLLPQITELEQAGPVSVDPGVNHEGTLINGLVARDEVLAPRTQTGDVQRIVLEGGGNVRDVSPGPSVSDPRTEIQPTLMNATVEIPRDQMRQGADVITAVTPINAKVAITPVVQTTSNPAEAQINVAVDPNKNVATPALSTKATPEMVSQTAAQTPQTLPHETLATPAHPTRQPLQTPPVPTSLSTSVETPLSTMSGPDEPPSEQPIGDPKIAPMEVKMTAPKAAKGGERPDAKMQPVAAAITDPSPNTLVSSNLNPASPAIEDDPVLDIGVGQSAPTNGGTQVAAFAAPSRPTPPVIQQIASAMAQAPGTTTQIALNPEELGTLRISLTTGDTGLVVNILADRPETSDLIRRHIDSLLQEFEDLGYDSPSFSFDQDENQTSSSHPDTGSPSLSVIDSAEPQATAIITTPRAGGLDLKL